MNAKAQTAGKDKRGISIDVCVQSECWNSAFWPLHATVLRVSSATTQRTCSLPLSASTLIHAVGLPFLCRREILAALQNSGTTLGVVLPPTALHWRHEWRAITPHRTEIRCPETRAVQSCRGFVSKSDMPIQQEAR